VTPLSIHKTDRGFTLIELLVVMALGLVVLGAVLNIFIKQNETSQAQQQIAYAQQNVRAAMDLMIREIRNAGYNPEKIPSFDPIPVATGTSIQVRSDYRGDDPGDPPDGDVLDPNEDVIYSIDGGQIQRNGQVLVDSPGGLAFGYALNDGTTYDPPGPGDPPLDMSNVGAGEDRRADIRGVIIFCGVMTADPAPDIGEYRMRPLMNATEIRNLRFKDVN
jgi:prepilin-type N-terminal cleavage/methylation domain-containing protein